jgi:hypothetical protein
MITSDITKIVCNAYNLKAMQMQIQDINFGQLLNKFNIQNNSAQGAGFLKLLQKEQTNLASNLATSFKNNLTAIDIGPNETEGGVLEYSIKLKQAKFFLELSNEVRKQVTSLIDKMTNTNI